MIVPKYWAESRVQKRDKRRQVTIRRYGWSDVSEAEAQSHADARANEAMARVLAGEKLHRRDHKIPYNGAEGLPIREEILSTHGEAVITRNSYGAHCLNTPNVLFADMDIEQPKGWLGSIAMVLATVLTAGINLWLHSSGACCEERFNAILLFWGTLLLTWIAFSFIVRRLADLSFKARGGARLEVAARQRIRDFVERHPDWGLRVYRTPAGFRVLASHATFAASQPEVLQLFSALRVDPIYARMCLNQQCFRARLTAKPWRAGISAHMRPSPGVWPISPDRVPIRATWVAEYERVASGFAACRFVETIGSGVVHPDVRSVIELHDSHSRAMSQLPLA